jgi:hypothetical protein
VNRLLSDDTVDDDYCDGYEGGEHAPCGDRCVAMRDPKGGDLDEFPPELRVREFPKSLNP